MNFRWPIFAVVIALAPVSARAEPAAPPAPAAGQSAPAATIDMPEQAGQFLGYCQLNFEICMNFIADVGQALAEDATPKRPEFCLPKGADASDAAERVLKWILLRPQTHRKPTNRTIADALIAIYPCKAAKAPGGSKSK
jgi:hypothetical protein